MLLVDQLLLAAAICTIDSICAEMARTGRPPTPDAATPDECARIDVLGAFLEHAERLQDPDVN